MAITFDAAAVSSVITGTNPTTTGSVGITVGAGQNEFMFVDIIVTNGGSQHFTPALINSYAITCGGVTFAPLGSVLIGNTDVAGFIWRFGAPKVPRGAQTVNMSLTESGQQFGQGYLMASSYLGVGSVAAALTAYATNAAPTISVPSGVGHVVSGVVADYNANPLTAPTFTVRGNQPTSGVPVFSAGDQPGAAGAVTFADTEAAGAQWGIVAMDMIPAPPPRINNLSQAVQASLR